MSIWSINDKMRHVTSETLKRIQRKQLEQSLQGTHCESIFKRTRVSVQTVLHFTGTSRHLVYGGR